MAELIVDPRRLCQLEIHSTDLERSVRFYELAFGWRRLPADMHEYVVLDVPRDCPFGISLVPNPNAKQQEGASRIVVYFGVSDPEDVVRRVVEAGGSRRFGPQRFGTFGEIYQVADPDGTRFGLYKGKS
jgi:predicted enzyme related to lactoylglutathione lyase